MVETMTNAPDLTGMPDAPVPPMLTQRLHAEDPAATVAYDIAIEAINQAIGCCTALIDRELKKPQPDQSHIRVDEWRTSRGEAVATRRTLEVYDTEAVEQATRRYSELAQQLEKVFGL